MTQKEIERLGRKQLLAMLEEQTGRSDRLEQENQRLKKLILDRETHLTHMGMLVEILVRNCDLDIEDSETAQNILKAIRDLEAKEKADGEEDE